MLWIHNNGFIIASLNLHDIFIQKTGKLKLKLDPFEIKSSMNNKLVNASQKQTWDIRLIGLVVFNCFIGETLTDDKIDQAEEILEFCVQMKRNTSNLSKVTIDSFLSKYPHLIIWIKNIKVEIFENLYNLISGNVATANDLANIDLFGNESTYLLNNNVTIRELVAVTWNMDKNMLHNVNDNQRGITTRFSSLIVKKLAHVMLSVFVQIFDRWNTEERAIYVLSWLQINEQSRFIVEVSHMLGISRRSVLSFFRKMIASYKIDDKLREIKRKYETSLQNK